MSAQEDRDLARRTARTLGRTGTLANLAGACVVFVILAILDAGEDVSDDYNVELLVLFVGTLALTAVVAALILSRHSRPLVRAIEHGEPIVGEPRRVLFQIPVTNSVVSAVMWGLAAITFGTYVAFRLDLGAATGLQVGITIMLGGITTASTLYLLLEVGLRPAFARAFADEEPDRPRGLGVGPRLILVWLVGSAIPIFVAMLFLLDGDDRVVDVQGDVLPWLVLAWIVGFGLVWRASRQIAGPLSDLRAAMSEVRTGRFAVRVPVDDATEVGLLQSGFNDMVAGLREREQLRDLFGRHVGADVARRALTSGAVLGGAHADATALFIDLADSTGLATRLDPADVVALLNDVFELVVGAVETEGGWVNKFQGDAALCVFGPPTGDADHRRRALRAARALRAELDGLAKRHAALRAGIGVSSGTVVAGNVGSERRYEYTVIGDPVNEAARLTELAKDTGGVLVSAATVDGAGADEAALWQPGAEVVLRGRAEPTLLYEPVTAATVTD